MWIRMMRVRNPNMPVMTIEESRRTQRPYRYGMILLCFGALANWLGLAENYAEPVRYLGVACIIAGALLICTAMCCWLHTPQRTSSSFGPEEGNHSGNVITAPNDIRCEKPPDYDTVATLMPPSYDDAIKLNPSVFLVQSTSPIPSSSSYPMPPPPTPADQLKENSSSASSSSQYPINGPPPIYTITTAMPNEVVTYENEQQSSSSSLRDVPTSSRSPSAQSAPVFR